MSLVVLRLKSWCETQGECVSESLFIITLNIKNNVCLFLVKKKPKYFKTPNGDN